MLNNLFYFLLLKGSHFLANIYWYVLYVEVVEITITLNIYMQGSQLRRDLINAMVRGHWKGGRGRGGPQ